MLFLEKKKFAFLTDLFDARWIVSKNEKKKLNSKNPYN